MTAYTIGIQAGKAGNRLASSRLSIRPASARGARPAGCLAAFLAVAWLSLAGARAQVNVLAWHNDSARTGQNLQETMLTPANVNTNQFGKLFACPVDGWVFAQPLYLANVPIPQRGTHNVVFVATEHGSVYAFDAEDNTGTNATPLWQTSFINPAAGVSTIPISYYGLPDPPELGITGTPVIDAAGGTLYVVAQTMETSSNSVHYVHRLHALDVRTGAEKPASPVVISPLASGQGAGSDSQGQIGFSAYNQLQRPGLLLLNGVVYAAFGSIGDLDPYHGWLVGYDAATLGQLQVFNDTPSGSQGGIWMSGAGPAADAAGNIYCITGNGTFDADTGGNDYGDSVIKLRPQGGGLLLTDYFTPYDQDFLEANDGDLGSGGALVLPDSMGSATHPHLLIGAGKEGVIYLLDRDNLGHFHAGADSQIVQSTPPGALPWGLFATPACFGNWVYFHGVNDVLKAYQITQARMSAQPISQASVLSGYPGATPSISANGASHAIIWEATTDAYASGGPAVLRAYDAQDLTRELYNSSQAGTRDQLGAAVRFTVPTIANGKVYVTAANQLAVFGLLPTPSLGPQSAGQTAQLRSHILGNTNSLALVDSDGDGCPDALETIAGTDPLNPASVLRITDVQVSGRDVVVSFPAIAGKPYTILSKDSLADTNNSWTARLTTGATSNGTLTFTDPAAVGAISNRFYRIQCGPNGEVVTEPAGFYTLPLNPGANALSVPLPPLPTVRGLVVALNGNTVTVKGHPGWGTNAFAPADGFDQYLLLVRQDALNNPGIQGDWWPVLSNSADTVTLQPRGDTLTNLLAIGDAIEIRRLTSLQDLFGSGSTLILTPDQDGAAATGDASKADVIRFVAGTAFGPPIFYHGGGLAPPGYYLGNLGPRNGSTLTLHPGQVFLVFRPTSSAPANLIITGQAQVSRFTQYLQAGPNAVGLPFAASAPIATSNLQESGWLSDHDGAAAAGNYAAADLLRPVTGTAFGPSVFNHDGTAGTSGWYSGSTLDNAFALQPGQAYIFFLGGANPVRWRQAVPYEP